MNKNLYLVLGVTLVFLVGSIAYLAQLGVFSSSRTVDPEAANSMATQSQQITQQMQATLEAQIAGQAMSDEQLRLDSPTGQALSRQCVEWTDFYDNHPQTDARENRDKACQELRDYVETGQLPQQ